MRHKSLEQWIGSGLRTGSGEGVDVAGRGVAVGLFNCGEGWTVGVGDGGKIMFCTNAHAIVANNKGTHSLRYVFIDE